MTGRVSAPNNDLTGAKLGTAKMNRSLAHIAKKRDRHSRKTNRGAHDSGKTVGALLHQEPTKVDLHHVSVEVSFGRDEQTHVDGTKCRLKSVRIGKFENATLRHIQCLPPASTGKLTHR